MQLAVAVRAHNEQTALVDRLRDGLARHEAALDGRTRLSEGDLWLWRMYRDRLKHDLAEAEQELFRRAKEVNARRQDLVAKAKERKLLERMRASQEAAFRLEENAREQREADEMATLRFGAGTF
nr:flagellar export protein FliJ [Desulfobaculum xiamenense]